ncbi:hypothetical protein PS6_003496 [Mucor atramentarius]
MLQQEMADLDFDTYFDVTSNSIHPHHPQQQQAHYDQAIHPTQQLDMPHRFNTPLVVPQLQQQQQQQQHHQQQQYYIRQQQQQLQPPQQSFEMFDWCFKQQQQHAQMLNSVHSTPVSTPGGNGISPHQTNCSPRPNYFYSAQQSHHHQHQAQANSSNRSSISPQFQIQHHTNEYNNANYVPPSEPAIPSQQQEHVMVTSNAPVVGVPPVNVAMATNATGLPTPMSDVIFPGTPQSRSSIQSSETNSPCSTSEPPATVSPVLDIPPPLTNAFAAIDQWGKSNEDEVLPEGSKESYHETRHWRKTKRSDSISSNTSNMVAAAVAAVAARSTPRNSSPVETGRQLKKVAHNAIERRYRNNINDRIRDLKNVVPALYKAKIREKKSNSSKSNTEEDDDDTAAAESSDDDSSSTKTGEFVDGVEVAKKLNKATILHKATEYIHHLKHTNELAERENQVLQQILAQMPGGAKVLARFQVQKLDFQQAEQQRLLAERKESMERERAERQRMLRERAAQRAALAELLPKPERRPYRRRNKKNTPTNSNDKSKSTEETTQEQVQDEQTAAGSHDTTTPSEPSTTNDATATVTTTTTSTGTSGNKAFMAMFLCLAIVSPLSFENTAAKPFHGGRALSQQQQISIRSLPSTTPSTFEYW